MFYHFFDTLDKKITDGGIYVLGTAKNSFDRIDFASIQGKVIWHIRRQ